MAGAGAGAAQAPQMGMKPQPGMTPPFDPAGGPVTQVAPDYGNGGSASLRSMGLNIGSLFGGGRGTFAPQTAPTKQAPIRPAPVDSGARGGSIYDRASRGLSAAMGATGTELGFQPSRVQGFGYEAPTIASQIGQFVNPYEQQVVSGALGDIERQRQMQANQLAAQFQGARAFGGSREAIQQAELGRQALEQGASTAASLRQQGFGQALQAAAQQAGMGQRAQEFGLGQGMQAQLANQAARLAGSQQRLGAASQLGSLANLGFGMGQTVQQQMGQQGAMQQALQQQIMDSARQQFEGFRNYPAQALGYYAQALGATPTPQSQQTTKQLGLMDYLTAGATIAPLIMKSDRRLKSNITQVGKLPSGQNVYTWTWNDKANELGLSGNSIGVMADETDPSMVSVGSDGYQMVNYGVLLA